MRGGDCKYHFLTPAFGLGSTRIFRAAVVLNRVFFPKGGAPIIPKQIPKFGADINCFERILVATRNREYIKGKVQRCYVPP